MIIDENDIFEEGNDEEMCPYADEVIGAVLFPKPFGFHWNDEVLSNFLKKLGFKIIGGTVAIKPGEKDVPDYNNLLEVFNDEAQKIIAKWLLKINTES